ncbi:MAG: efflux RND transporter periplasmic adaptor subunit [Blastocatellia bacterium]|nr:efflux RND transporter periplasmic adaptor subunit [Blastocatellia bacterium]
MSLQLEKESSENLPRGGRAMWPLIALAALIIAGLIGFAYWRRSAKAPETAAPAAEASTGTVKFLMEQQWRVKMMLAKAESQEVAQRITATGRVIPAAQHQAIVAPPVGGLIAGNILPRIGQRVARGQTIAVLRQALTAAESSQIAAANSQIAAANAQLQIESARFEAERRSLTEKIAAAKAELDEAKHDFDRTQRLYARQAISQQRVEQEEARFKVAEANHNAALEQIEVLKATEKSKAIPPATTPTNYTVTAPIAGTIVKVHKAMGEQVAPGEAIVEIVNLETIWVEAPIFERDLEKLRGRTRAVFTTTADPETELSGTVVDISPVIDAEKRTANVIFAVPNKGQRLRIGMQADVRLDTGESVDALVIPAAAVLEHEGKKIVYVLLSGEEFERREVTLGQEVSGRVAVLSGLKAGERVVTQGALQLKLQELNPADAGAHSHET